MKELELLKASRELISKRSHWCKRTLAKDIKGIPVSPTSEAACKWCAHGVIFRIQKLSLRRFSFNDRVSAFAALAEATDADYIDEWNDTHTHAEVLAGFDKAIAMLERKAKRK